VALFAISTMGYVRAGWPLGDAAYMVLLTIFSVGYGEVRPIDGTFLRLWTTMTIVLGCTGMIVLTGARSSRSSPCFSFAACWGLIACIPKSNA
jgi:trk system potassium uptake protein TrkA/voltage-gated potassium channel